MNAPKSTKAPKAPRPAARPKPRASAHEPPQGEKTATREGESSHAAPVTTSPVKSTRAAAEGSPASAQPSTATSAPTEPAARLLRLPLDAHPAPVDLRALFRSVGQECALSGNGALALGLVGALSLADDVERDPADVHPEEFADAYAALAAAIGDDLAAAAKDYRAVGVSATVAGTPSAPPAGLRWAHGSTLRARRPLRPRRRRQRHHEQRTAGHGSEVPGTPRRARRGRREAPGVAALRRPRARVAGRRRDAEALRGPRVRPPLDAVGPLARSAQREGGAAARVAPRGDAAPRPRRRRAGRRPHAAL